MPCTITQEEKAAGGGANAGAVSEPDARDIACVGSHHQGESWVSTALSLNAAERSCVQLRHREAINWAGKKAVECTLARYAKPEEYAKDQGCWIYPVETM